MRVLHLTTELPPIIYGGLGTAVGGLVNASARAGLIVGALLPGYRGWGGYAPPQAREAVEPRASTPAHVSVFEIADMDGTEEAIRVVREWQPDVLHLHAFWLWPIARAIQREVGIPLVYTVHSLDRAEYEIGQGPPECLAQWKTQLSVVAGADRVIALTRSERDLLIQYCPEAQDRIRIVGNGIDDSVAARTAAGRRRCNEPATILYTGRFVDRKGVRELIAAIPEVLERVPLTRFVLAGGHRHCTAEEMKQRWLPPELGRYENQIHFAGWLAPQELAAWYRAADILVVPSWYEPFGMVVLEGMLYGLPIAAAAVGGPMEILQHGETGLLFPPKDERAVAASLLQLLEDAGFRQRLGAAAAREVRRTWLWDRMTETIRAVYQEAVLAKVRTTDACAAGLTCSRLNRTAA